jgi:hypothetical protein
MLMLGKFSEGLDLLGPLLEDEELTDDLRFEILVMHGRCLVGLDLPEFLGKMQDEQGKKEEKPATE